MVWTAEGVCFQSCSEMPSERHIGAEDSREIDRCLYVAVLFFPPPERLRDTKAHMRRRSDNKIVYRIPYLLFVVTSSF